MVAMPPFPVARASAPARPVLRRAADAVRRPSPHQRLDELRRLTRCESRRHRAVGSGRSCSCKQLAEFARAAATLPRGRSASSSCARTSFELRLAACSTSRRDRADESKICSSVSESRAESRVSVGRRVATFGYSTLPLSSCTSCCSNRPLRRGRVGHQVDALHLGDRLDDRLVAFARGAGQHVVRHADVLRRVLGVPHKLLRKRVLRD